MWKIGFICILVNFVYAGVYENFKVYEVIPQTENQAFELIKWREVPGFDFWSEARMLNASCDIMVRPDLQLEFERFLQNNEYTWKILENNVQRIIDKFEKSRMNKIAPRAGQFSFKDYQRHGVMNDYLDQLANMYPQYITVKNEGKSYEGRNIKSAYITDGENIGKKATMIIDCGIHAREWIAPAFCIYLIQQLVENRSQYSDMLYKVNWFIVPLLNPDGYEYTHTHERLWRKTRRPDEEQPRCIGVDGNRNYAYEWGGAGTSSDPCSNVFRGPKPFSEPETKLMGDLITSISNANPGKVGYLTFHSYGYWFLHPWGHSEFGEEPPFAHKIQRAEQKAVDAVHRFSGGVYKAGNSAQLLYAAAGGSDDFAMGAAGIELSLTVELPPRGFATFLLPPEKILPVCNETMEAVRAFGQHLADEYLD